MFKFDFYDFTAPLESRGMDTLADMSFEPQTVNAALAKSLPPLSMSQALMAGDDYAGDATTTAFFTGISDSLYISDDGTSSDTDRDWIAFDIEQDQIVTLSWDDYNAFVRVVDESGQNQFLTSFSYAFMTEPGRYYVEVIHPAGSQAGLGGFVLNFDISYDDYSNNSETTARLGEDGSSIFLEHNGVGDRGDSDWVGIELIEGESVTFSSTASQEGSFNFPDGTRVFLELNEPIVIEESGLYFVEIYHFFSPITEGEGATLSVRREIADIAANPSTLGTIAIDGAPTQSQLEEVGDIDWFAVTAEAGDAINFAVTERGFTNVQMRLVDADGNNVEGFDFGNYGPNLEFTHEFAESGTYYLQVREAWDAWAGSYEITAVQLNNPVVGIDGQYNELTGSKFNDVITGGNFENYIYALAGDDIIFGGGGSNVILAGPGDDIITDLTPSGYIDGGTGNDNITVSSNVVNSRVDISGGAGDDVITDQGLLPTQNFIFAGDGDDIIRITISADEVNGDNGNDIIYAGSTLKVYGGSGDDIVYSRLGYLPSGDISVENFSGGDGTDTLDLTVTRYQQFDYRAAEFELAVIRDTDGVVLGRYRQSESRDYYTQYDTAGSRDWSRYVTVFDIDPDAAWSRKEFIYDDVGALMRSKVLDSSGALKDIIYDTTNSVNYQTRELTYVSEEGALAEIDTLFDTGRRNIVTYDTDNSEPEWDVRSETQDLGDTAAWATSTSYYIELNGALAKTRFVLERDDSYTSDEVYTVQGPLEGASVRTLSDAAGDQSWESWTFDYNVARQVTESVRVNDNGVVTTLTYDRGNDFEWATRSRNEDTADAFNWTTTDRLVDAAGRTQSLEILYDEGFTVLNEYDLTSEQLWARKVTRTEVDGDITQFFYDDDGALYDTVYI